MFKALWIRFLILASRLPESEVHILADVWFNFTENIETIKRELPLTFNNTFTQFILFFLYYHRFSYQIPIVQLSPKPLILHMKISPYNASLYTALTSIFHTHKSVLGVNEILPARSSITPCTLNHCFFSLHRNSFLHCCFFFSFQGSR